MTHYLDAVDTGVKYFAVAQFVNGQLYRAVLTDFVYPIPSPNAAHEWSLVIECATVRRQDGHTRRKEVDALNRSAGRIGALHPNPTYWKAEEWKGQLTKKISHERTVKLLTPEELLVLKGKKAAELKHVLDAVGIGLRALGRR